MISSTWTKKFAALPFLIVGSWQTAGWGQTIQVRDAIGGENAEAEPGWFYLTGTGAYTQGTNGLDEFFRDLHTGTFDLEIDFNYGQGGSWQELLTYCIELREGITFGPNIEDNANGLPFELAELTTINGITSDEQDILEILWSNAFAESTASRAGAAAFQSVVWEVVNDESVDLMGGNFMLNENDPHTAQVITQAQGWLDNVEDGTWTSRTPLMALTNPESQDLILPIPEPASISLLLVGAGMVLRRKIA